ncbi:YchJ family protein [Dokdonella sp.]|uniref:YchJ family protein n=1 Tax=Dokdonella sp. TaxID=2291710 RepID=UPI003526EB03
MNRQIASVCPCDPTRDYVACCGRWHAGLPAPEAESLMRSRYSAYALGLADYVLATWHASTRPAQLELAAPANSRTIWLGLKIKEHVTTGSDSAEVEFVARYRQGGASAKRLHERSRFVREHGRWFYLDGESDPAT